jgi:hypothetical protein
MITLILQRHPTVKATTLGQLSIDGVPQCDTLEDVIREVPGVPVETWKIPNVTAIPAGLYRLILVHSPKFGPETLSIESVPGFQDIRIHGGNTDLNTEGCVLVGQAHPELGDGGEVLHSQDALKALKAIVVPRLEAGEEGWIDILNPEGE